MRFIKFDYGGALVVTPSNRYIVIDTGPANRGTRKRLFPIMYYMLAPFKTVTEIDVIITHWHYSTHTQGLKHLIDGTPFRVNNLYNSGVYSTDREPDEEWKNEMINLLDKKGGKEIYVKYGDTIEDDDLKIDILSPHATIKQDKHEPGSYTDNPNSVGAVITRFQYGDFALIHPGDRGGNYTWNTEDNEMEGDPLSLSLKIAKSDGYNLESTVMHNSHHSTSIAYWPDEMLNIVKPKVAILSHHENSDDVHEHLETNYTHYLDEVINIEGKYNYNELQGHYKYPIEIKGYKDGSYEINQLDNLTRPEHPKGSILEF